MGKFHASMGGHCLREKVAAQPRPFQYERTLSHRGKDLLQKAR